MVAPRRYPEELRERSIRLTLDARKDPATRAGACRRIGEQLGINPETLRGWVSQAEVDAGDRSGTATIDTARLVELERENRELRRANGILRSASAFFAAELDRPSRDHRLRRCAQGQVRRRADLHHAENHRCADRSEHLLRRQGASALSQVCARRRGQDRDLPGAQSELRRLRNPQDPCPAPTRERVGSGPPSCPLHDPAVDEIPWSARDLTGEGPAHHDPRHRPGQPARPRRSAVHRYRSGSPLGGRHHLRPYIRRLGLLRVHPRRLQPPRGGLADLYLAAHRPRSGRAEHGSVDPPA
jgi:transposase